MGFNSPLRQWASSGIIGTTSVRMFVLIVPFVTLAFYTNFNRSFESVATVEVSDKTQNIRLKRQPLLPTSTDFPHPSTPATLIETTPEMTIMAKLIEGSNDKVSNDKVSSGDSKSEAIHRRLIKEKAFIE